jgi:hypothetical protein
MSESPLESGEKREERREKREERREKREERREKREAGCVTIGAKRAEFVMHSTPLLWPSGNFPEGWRNGEMGWRGCVLL